MDLETKLWRAVLLRAIRDAVPDDENSVSDEDCAEARNFLLRDTVDFDMVVTMAGYDPAWVRAKLKKVI